MMDDKILSKIKKCLALAKSSNPNEAATALRQAQKLIEKHGFSEEDINLARVNASEHSAGTAATPPRWHGWLVSVVSSAFGASAVYVSTTFKGKKVKFIGIDSQAEIAGYAYEVLHRQVKRDRLDHISEQKRCKRATKTRRGDLFAEAWVNAVSQTVTAFAQPEEHKHLIEAWKSREYPDIGEMAPREHKAKSHDHRSQLAGYMKGKAANLRHGMGAEQSQRLGVVK
jgi:hypothetical protein